MEHNLIHFLALQLTPGIGNTNAKHLVSYIGDPEEIFQANARKLHRIPGIREKSVKSILKRETFTKAEEILKDCERQNIKILHYTSKNYPNRLKSIIDSPSILYFQGNGDLNPENTISIVGTRKATQYGRDVTESMVRGLKPYGATVISGLAYGIDIESHRRSLEMGLPTFAVLAGGLDKVYPKSHLGETQQMMENGGILSEYPPGTKPEAPLFPARNRIIAGLGDATVVVEAGVRGGALITANLADSYNRPVFSVPGNLDQPFSIGCNRLIRSQKALAYTEVKDLVYYLNWEMGTEQDEKKQVDISNLDEYQKSVYQILSEHLQGIAIDELSWKSQIQINQLATVLLSMEFDGYVKCLPGKKYILSPEYQ